jgi:hypothetical protein
LQLVCRTPIQNFSHCAKKTNFIRNSLSDLHSLDFSKKIKVRGIYIWRLRWMMEPLQWVMFEIVSRHF